MVETIKPKVPVKRMVFHEITRPAIQAAVANPREIDRDLVDAQEARRILDRLYGYEVSPVLWKKVMPRLSAGRVQSVATRIVVERERQRMAFRSAEYWDILATLDAAPYQAELDRAVANLQRAQAAYTNAASALSRDKQLLATGVIAKARFENTDAAAKQALADVRSMEAAQERFAQKAKVKADKKARA